MANLGQGSALPDVSTTTTQTTSAPDYYTGYLSDLAKAGTTATSMDPSKMVAGFSDLQKSGLAAVPGAADAYKPGLTAAEQTAAGVAGGLTPERIQALMNPYTSGVVDEMGRLQQQNIQRNLMPALKAGFVGTGGMGSQRYANALGQASGDWQANLLGAQTGALQKGYADAVNAALQNLQIQNQAATTQGNLAGKEQELGLAGAEAQMNAGAKEQALEQAKIEAPLKMATNASALFRGLNVPTSTTQKYTGPMPGAYGASPLQQIAGLGALFASGAGGTSAMSGFGNALSGLGSYLSRSLGQAPDSTTQIANTANEGEPGYGWKYYSDGTAIDPAGNYYYQGQQVWTNPASGGGAEMPTNNSIGGTDLGNTDYAP
jgi:hypothetical protein